ncbi:MAG: carboxymuconolactone decarboxylase family protein [Candidatus Zambryskibacteria bacterium]|nr:carboxymuconolactone decarboxylase family protein [Candidatus Zambryskibacteria bacterium]
MALISSLGKDQIEESIRGIYEKFEEDTGKTPEWVKVMAHRPIILKEFVELFGVVMNNGEIETLLKWKIALEVSKTLKCPFCVDVTEKMLKKLGASEQEITKITGQNSGEAEILELVKDVTLDGHLDRPELFEKLKDKFNESQIVEIVSVMGLFNYINRFNNTLGVLPE